MICLAHKEAEDEGMGIRESRGADLEKTKYLPLGHTAEATPPPILSQTVPIPLFDFQYLCVYFGL